MTPASPTPIDRRQYGDLADDVCLLRSDGRTVARFKGGFRVDSHPEIFSATQVSAMAESVRARREAVEAAMASRRKPDSPRRPLARHEIERPKPNPAPETRLCGCEKCCSLRVEEMTSAGAPFHLTLRGPGLPGWAYACDICGNKRCPHHADHALACTNSNEPGQIGSNYPAPDVPVGGGAGTAAASGPGSPSAIHSDEGNSAHEGADDGIGLHGSSGGFSAGRGNRSANDRDGNSLGNDRRHEAAPNGYAGPDRGSAGALRPSAKADESREEPVNNRAAAGLTRGAARLGERDRRTVEPARGDLHAAGRITLAGDAALGARVDGPSVTSSRRTETIVPRPASPQSDGAEHASDTPALEARGEAGTIRVAIEPAGEAAGNGGGHHDAGLKTRQPEVARAAPPMTDSDRIAALEARLDRFERVVRDAVAELVERLDAGWGNGR